MPNVILAIASQWCQVTLSESAEEIFTETTVRMSAFKTEPKQTRAILQILILSLIAAASTILQEHCHLTDQWAEAMVHVTKAVS